MVDSPGINARISGEGDKLVKVHARLDMGLNRPLDRLDLAGFLPALRGKAGVFLRESNAFLTNDYAVKVAPVVDLDHFAGMDILGDEHSVEDGEGGIEGGPGRAVKARQPGGEQQLYGRRALNAKGCSAYNVGGITGL